MQIPQSNNQEDNVTQNILCKLTLTSNKVSLLTFTTTTPRTVSGSAGSQFNSLTPQSVWSVLFPAQIRSYPSQVS